MRRADTQQIGRDQRVLAEVVASQVAREAVQENGAQNVQKQSAGILAAGASYRLPDHCRNHSVRMSPVPPVAMPGLPVV